MNPQRPPRQLTKEALAKEFTIKFTRAELLGIYNILSQLQYRIGDAKVVIPIMEKIDSPANTLIEQDFEPMPKAPSIAVAPAPGPAIAVN